MLISPSSRSGTDQCVVSGLSAAHTIYLAGGNVLLLDKNSTCKIVAQGIYLTERLHRLLRRQFDKGNVGYQRRFDSNAGR